MGRYDVDYYEQVPACRPENHRFGMNGTCFVCKHSKTDLTSEAKRILELADQGWPGQYAG